MKNLTNHALPAFSVICVALLTVGNHDRAIAFAQNAPSKSRQATQKQQTAKQGQPAAKGDQLVPLNKSGTVLLDLKGKRLLLTAKVVLREGLLEMLCCRKQTKEHESILSVDAKAYVIHTGLLALQAKPGTPVRFTPKFKSATGQRIDVFLHWKEKNGKLHRVPAQKWLRHSVNRFYATKMKALPVDVKLPEDSELRFDKRNQELVWYGQMTDKQRREFLALSKDKAFRKAIQSFYKRSQPRPMKAHWVFGGSRFFVDKKTGEKFYQAEGGDLICVANFPTAMMDVAIQSSASGEQSLLFEADRKHIPPLETAVTIELVPVFKKPGAKKQSTRKKPVKSDK